MKFRSSFLDIAMFDSQPLTKNLSGLRVEYRLVSLYSRDTGKREANLEFNVGQGTQDIGFRNAVPILFNCVPSTEVVLNTGRKRQTHDGFIIDS